MHALGLGDGNLQLRENPGMGDDDLMQFIETDESIAPHADKV